MQTRKKRKPHAREAYPKQPTLFHHEQTCEHGTTQTTNVNVTIEDKGEDCLSGCFKALAGLGKKAAQ